MKKKSPSNPSLLQYVRERYNSGYSGKQIKKAIDQGFCLVNGRIERFASIQIRPTDVVVFREEGLIPLQVETVFEDEWLFVFKKPSGMDVQLLAKQGFLVHRLDKPTSGLLVVAKTVEVKEAMDGLFRERKVAKRYVARVEGEMETKEGSITARVGGKEALTYWKVLQKSGGTSLLLLTPVTGRTHQLRIHMASIGYPIVGDHQYGRRGPSRLQLHAEEIAFDHPKTGQPLLFRAKRPFA